MSPSARAATRTWTGLGLTNNWTESANWAGGLLPGAVDIATFDATGAKPATINAAINVAGISIAGTYPGVITQSAAVTVGASGFSQSGGFFVGGAAAITLNGFFSLAPGGSFTSTNGTFTVTGAFTDTGGTFVPGTGTVAFSGGATTIDVAATETFNNLTFTAGAKTISAGDTLTAGGSLTLTAGSLAGTGTVAARGNISQALGYGGGAATLLVDGPGA
ncbi:MAG: hypothetical protein M3P84_08555, partial [Chloroflexota bacterium]|nr:hypothetical protein [Chloroflexota bacterium]